MASSSNNKEARAIGLALLFLAPNILGFMVFTLIPIVISFVMAFTNWDLTLHNNYTDTPLKFIGLGNFIALFQDAYFWQYMGNTFFLMLGIPFGIAGSLGAALLLNGKIQGPSNAYRKPLTIMAVSLSAGLLLLAIGLFDSAFITLIVGLIGIMLIGGTAGGSTVYRTLYYLPHFTQGVAVFILWKKLYSPHTGPINQMLYPILDSAGSWVLSLPASLADSLYILPLLAIVAVLAFWLKGSLFKWREGELGVVGQITGVVLMGLGMWITIASANTEGAAGGLLNCVTILAAILGLGLLAAMRNYTCDAATGTGGHAIFTGTLLSLVVLGIVIVSSLAMIRESATVGLEPPKWLSDYVWAKPSLIIMGLWAAIGSNNMILYLAGLSNISPVFYEAADIDGASQWQKFRYITWPQLAPVTFFIVVMSVIYGLQGGFEMAKTMTGGGPAGATTTLSYYIYSEGFETGRLGYASAVAWVLFLLVFVMSMLNWKFGNRHVSE